MNSLRSRVDAYETIMDADRADGKNRKDKEGVGTDTALQRRRILTMSRDPLKLLHRSEVDPDIDLGGSVKERMAPNYLTHIYHSKKKAIEYFESIINAKTLSGTPLSREVFRLAEQLDDFLYRDDVDMLNSVGVERIVRRLYGVELALREYGGGRSDLGKIDWSTADEYDLSYVDHAGFHHDTATEEVRKRLERRATFKKYQIKATVDGKPK